MVRIPALLVLLGFATAFAQTPSYVPPQTPVLIPENYAGSEITLKAWMKMPEGAGPFSVVILLHGCNGLDRAGWQHANDWASWLNRIGFAALILDSFSPRNVANICGNGEVVSGELQAADLYTAAEYAANLAPTRGRKIGAIGFSHGGWGILEADANIKPGIRELRDRLRAANIAVTAFVAMYPACFRHVRAEFYAPLLILIGQNDDWTRAESCNRLMANARATEPELRLKVYPGAVHSFDVKAPPRSYFGHVLRYDGAATADARAEIEGFFNRWLR